MKRKIFKLSAITVLLVITFSSCQKSYPISNVVKFVNGTDNNLSIVFTNSVFTNWNMELVSIETDSNINFDSDYNSENLSAIIEYNGKFYEEKSALTKRSIINLDNYVKVSKNIDISVYIYFITEEYILSLSEVENPIE
jgi:hypothetical protein